MILKFHSQIQFVKGYLRTAIYDLQREAYDFMPNVIYEKLIALEHQNKATIESVCDEDELLWLSFLLDQEYAFYIPEVFKDNFPPLSLQYSTPSLLTNAIIEVSDYKKKYHLTHLETLNCKHLAFYFVTPPKNEDEVLTFLASNLAELTFNAIDLIFQSLPPSLLDHIKTFTTNAFNEIHQVDIKLESPKAFIPKFVLNQPTYLESLHGNTYFNRKIFVDRNEDIFNGIETITKFGNLKQLGNQTDFKNLLEQGEITTLWNINKNDLDVCRDCEFRHMCIDNRIPKQRNNGSFYIEKECTYNPYIAQWQHEAHYKSLSQLGIINNGEGFSIEHETITEINQAIWEA